MRYAFCCIFAQQDTPSRSGLLSRTQLLRLIESWLRAGPKSLRLRRVGQHGLSLLAPLFMHCLLSCTV